MTNETMRLELMGIKDYLADPNSKPDDLLYALLVDKGVSWPQYAKQPDLVAAGIDDAQKGINHFCREGYKEYRVNWSFKLANPQVTLPPDWDWKVYVAAYPDLQQAGIDTQAEAEWHYLNYGFYEGRWPVPQSPEPGAWQPPATPGWHDITGNVSGPFFMGGCRTSTGLRIGTYKPAKWYEFDGALKLMGSGPQESFYSFYKSLITTEYPAGVWDGVTKRWEGSGSSLAFDIHEISGGLSLFTLNTFGGDTVTMMKSTDSGQNWSAYATVKGHLIQCYSNGSQEFLVGEKDNFPYICDLKGQKIMQDSSYVGQMINFACWHKGVAVLGCNSIGLTNPEEGSSRNGYFTYWDGSHHIAGKYPNGNDANLTCPYVMNIKQDPDKDYVYAVASIWNETGYPQPELARSKDGKNWEKFGSVPMPSVQTIEVCDGGIYCYGGKYGEYGKVMFLKF